MLSARRLVNESAFGLRINVCARGKDSYNRDRRKRIYVHYTASTGQEDNITRADGIFKIEK